MRAAPRLLLAALVAACLAAAGRAAAPVPEEVGEELEEEVELDLRASAEAAPGSAIVDRGSRDGVAPGDRVLLRLRGGERLPGRVSEVRDRTAVVELRDPRAVVPAGTPGRVWVRVPEASGGPPADAGGEPEVSEPLVPGAAPEHPGWERTDEEHTPDMPLLAEVRAVRPEDRTRRVTGRVYVAGDAVQWTDGESRQAFLRSGTDLRVDNPFWVGGGLRFDAEVAHRVTDMEEGPGEELDTTRLRLDRFSYAWGGTRFDGDRRQLGRFLQHSVPELGILDGFEYEHRFAGGSRLSASVGYMPEPDLNMEMGKDFQVAAAYHWFADATQRAGATAAYQKTWHKASQDRDLLLLKAYSRPEDGWDLAGTLWIDLYTGGEELEDSKVELTQAFARAAHATGGGGEVELRYTRFLFADVHRAFLPPPGLGEVADGRFDRLAVAHTAPLSERHGFFGELGAWVDEDDEGGDVELGVERTDLRRAGDRAEVAVFGVAGSFETVLGLRLGYSWPGERGRWRLGYEVSNRDQVGFLDENDDLLQHGLRVERELRTSWGWDVSARGDVWIWEDEGAVALGIYAQRSF